MLDFNLYLKENERPKNPKPGDIWKTSDGGFRGVNQSGNPKTFKDKEKTQKYVATKDAPKDEPEKKEKPKDLDTDNLKAKQLALAKEIKDSGVGEVMSAENRIQDLKIRAEFEEDEKEAKKAAKALDNVTKTLSAEDMPKDRKDAVGLAMALGYAYSSRTNTGVGLNSLGMADRDALVTNMPRLLQMYDDAIPKEVEKGVRAARKYRYSEAAVQASFKALPKKLQDALKRKGKVGDSIDEVGGHFLGYEAINPNKKPPKNTYITSDFRDPNIVGSDKSDNPDTDKLKIKRGNTGSAARGMAVWRIYLEQGGIDAYTGMSLDLESMDLEHVVGYNNSDGGDPTTEDYANREHERNQILCSSRANQQKSDQSMKDFNTNNVDSLKDMDEKDFEAREGAYKTVNEGTTVTQQTALRLQGDIMYKLKGGGVTDKADDPNIEKNEKGLPKVADATLGENVTAEVLQKEFEAEDTRFNTMKNSLVPPKGPVDDPEDVKTIMKLKSKLGRRTVQAMGLPRGTTDVDGRRTNPIYSTDTGYRTFLTAMAAKPYKDRQVYKDTWTEGIALVGTKEVRDIAGGSKDISQQKIFDAYIRGDVKALKDMGLKLDSDVEKKLGDRGNILGESVKPEYESMASAVRRVARANL